VVDVAMEYRTAFQRDVVIDMVCYRRYGHNEGDEPSYTQPLLYQKIKAHPSVAHLYGDALARDKKLPAEEIEKMWADAKARLDAPVDASKAERAPRAPCVYSRAAPSAPHYTPKGDARGCLDEVVRAVSSVPEGFEVHP